MATGPDVQTDAQRFLIAVLRKQNLTLSDWLAFSDYSTVSPVTDSSPGAQPGSQPDDICGEGVRWLRDSYRPLHGYLSLVVCVLGFLANVVNIVVLTRKGMRSSTNAILTGLAVADGAVLLEYIPFAVQHYISTSSDAFSLWTARYVLFHAHFAQIFHTASIFMTVMLATWRYLLIVETSAAVRRCTVRRTCAVMAGVFALSPLVCLPSYLAFSVQRRPAGPGGGARRYSIDISAAGRRHNGLLNRLNFWMYSVVIKLAPCLVLTYLSVRLIGALLETARRRRRLLAAGTAAPPGGQRGPLAQSVRTTNRTTGLMVIVLLLFLITELPQGVLALLSGVLQDRFFRTCYQHVGELLDILALTNSAVNFLLYCLMCKQFRVTFCSLFGVLNRCHRPPQQLLLTSLRSLSFRKSTSPKTTLV